MYAYIIICTVDQKHWCIPTTIDVHGLHTWYDTAILTLKNVSTLTTENTSAFQFCSKLYFIHNCASCVVGESGVHLL